MKKMDFLSILITFVVGLFAGGYLYLTGYAPMAVEIATPNAEKISEFIVQGELYGGCRNRCPSFQVLSDGSYRYLYVPEGEEEEIIRQGTLPSNLQRNLRKNLSEEALVKQSKSSVLEKCSSDTDGVDVAYEITIDGKEYKLDSCKTAVDGGSKLWLSLHEVWGYYNNL